MADNKMIVKNLDTNHFWVFDLTDDGSCPDGWAQEDTIADAGHVSETWYFDENNFSDDGACASRTTELTEAGFTKQN